MPATHLLLAPGASGSIERLAPHQSGLEARGLTVTLVELPRTKAERAVPVYANALEAAGHGAAVGGHSFGGRVASLMVADATADADVAGLVLLSYPLHAPGRQEAWDERTQHWPRIRCPVLLLSGESDPFARIDLLRSAADRLSDARLVTFPGVGHGLERVLDAALEEVVGFLRDR